MSSKFRLFAARAGSVPAVYPQQDVMDLIRELRNRTGPNGTPLTIGQFSRIIPSAAMPHLDASEAGEAVRP